MKVAVIFNGQGAQFEGMGLDFREHFPEARAVFNQASEATGLDMVQLVSEDFSKLRQTKYAQPAIGTVSLAIWASIRETLPQVDYMAGLSLGEYAALMASGIFTVSDGLRLLFERGQVMSDVCEEIVEDEPMQMLAVIGMSREVVEHLVEDLSQTYLANFNSPEQIILAGPKTSLKLFNQAAKAAGYRKGLPLKVEGPFHTPLMVAACQPLEALLDSYELQPGCAPVISNTTVEPHDLETLKSTLVRHLIEPVQWEQTIDWLIQAKVTHLIQIGPGQTLQKLLKAHDQAPSCLAISQVEDVSEIEKFLNENKGEKE